MRISRVEKFKKHRHEKTKHFIIFALFLPCASILIGYLLTSLVILPAIKK